MDALDKIIDEKLEILREEKVERNTRSRIVEKMAEHILAGEEIPADLREDVLIACDSLCALPWPEFAVAFRHLVCQFHHNLCHFIK